MRNNKYRAFISYSHVDRKWARWIHKALETWRLPKHLVGTVTAAGPLPERLAPVFRDRDDLPSAPDLTDRIRDALEHSDNLVVVCSPNSARSTYVDTEVRLFRDLGRGDHIFCIIVDGDPADVGGDSDCFCPALREGEPIAADARPGGDGRPLARLKIIAGMLGLGLDDLRRRELVRRQKRLAAITGLATVAFAVTAVLAINAMIARNEAEQRREQAEDLLSFMVGDLYERLEPIGRLDVLDDVGVSAMDYYATVKTSQLTDVELLRHAQVLTQIGQIRLAQHQYDDALASFAEAFERSAAHFDSSPGDAARLFNRGQAEFWVGYVHWRRGDLTSATRWLARYAQSGDEVVAMEPENPDYALEAVYGHHNLAVLALEAGDLDAAESAFNNEIDSLRVIGGDRPDADITKEIADAISWLGNIYLERGQLTESLEYYEKSVALLEAAFVAEENDRNLLVDLTNARQSVINTMALLGDTARALSISKGAVATFARLVASDPANDDWRRRLANARVEQGFLLLSTGEGGAAMQEATKALAALGTIEGDDVFTKAQLGKGQLLLAELELAAGKAGAAGNAAAQGLEHMAFVADSDRLNHERLAVLANLMIVEGEARATAGDAGVAQASWQRANALLDEKAASSASPYVRGARARLDRLREAAGD
jgi:tetratricopeptide (TPR) repeat protein